MLWGKSIVPIVCWSPWTASVANKNLILYLPLSLVETVTPSVWNLSVSLFQFSRVAFLWASIFFSYYPAAGTFAMLPLVVGAQSASIRREPRKRVTASWGLVTYLSFSVIPSKLSCTICPTNSSKVMAYAIFLDSL